MRYGGRLAPSTLRLPPGVQYQQAAKKDGREEDVKSEAEELLRANCRYCLQGGFEDMQDGTEKERQWHCMEIWLHAFKYSVRGLGLFFTISLYLDLLF